MTAQLNTRCTATLHNPPDQTRNKIPVLSINNADDKDELLGNCRR